MSVLTFLNGDTMPILGLGTFQAKPGVIHDVVVKAVELGYRHLDCAHIYGNEKEIGKALEYCISKKLVSRNDLWITSKLWNDSHRKEHVRPAVERTLEDLRLEYLDLYLVHWPIAFRHGVRGPKSATDFVSLNEIPLSETWAAMQVIHGDGLARHIGISNFSVSDIDNLIASADIKPEMNQVELHPYLAQKELTGHCHKHHIHVTAYSSFGSKARPDTRDNEDVPLLLEHPAVRDIALRRGMTPAQVLLAWTIRHGISVIPKSVNPSRLEQNLRTLDFTMQQQDMRTLDQLDNRTRFVRGDFWDIPGSPYSSKTLWGP